MKRLTSVVLACLATILGVAIEPSSHIARASELRYKSVPLDSLPLVQSDSQNATILTPGNPGRYRDQTLNSGVQIRYGTCNGPGNGGYAEFDLSRKYGELSGTIYEDTDTDRSGTSRLTIYDATDPSNKHMLYGIDVPGHGQAHFRIRVSDVGYLLLHQDTGCTSLDFVATLSIGSPLPTQVVPRYPTGNAGVPAESKVLFGWQPFPYATNYALHIWLTGLSGSITMTNATPLTFAATIHHKME